MDLEQAVAETRTIHLANGQIFIEDTFPAPVEFKYVNQ
jgi:hypothetical protein